MLAASVGIMLALVGLEMRRDNEWRAPSKGDPQATAIWSHGCEAFTHDRDGNSATIAAFGTPRLRTQR